MLENQTIHSVVDLLAYDDTREEWLVAGPGQLFPVIDPPAKGTGCFQYIAEKFVDRYVLHRSRHFDYRFRVFSIVSEEVEEEDEEGNVECNTFFKVRTPCKKSTMIPAESMLSQSADVMTCGRGTGLFAYYNSRTLQSHGCHRSGRVDKHAYTLDMDAVPVKTMCKALSRPSVEANYMGRMVPSFFIEVWDFQEANKKYKPELIIDGFDLGTKKRKRFIKIPVPFILKEFKDLLLELLPNEKKDINEALLSYYYSLDNTMYTIINSIAAGMKVYVGLEPDRDDDGNVIVYEDLVSMEDYSNGKFPWSVKQRSSQYDPDEPLRFLESDLDKFLPWYEDPWACLQTLRYTPQEEL